MTRFDEKCIYCREKSKNISEAKFATGTQKDGKTHLLKWKSRTEKNRKRINRRFAKQNFLASLGVFTSADLTEACGDFTTVVPDRF